VTAAPPSLESGERVALTITVDGTAFDSDRLLSVETWSGVNRIPRARLVIYDGDPATGEFPLSQSETFKPGATVVIAAGYGSGSQPLHSGKIIRHAIRISPGAAAELVVETADPLLAMTLARHSAVSTQSADSDLIAKLVAANDGTMGTNEARSAPVEALVQYHASDWDLLLIRAEASGCLVIVEASRVDVVSPADGGEAVLQLAYGDSIISLEATADASLAYADDAVKSHAWNYADQTVAEGGAAAAGVTLPGNFAPAEMAGVFGVSPFLQQTAALLDEDALGAWSTARLMRARLAQVQGSATFQGTAAVKPGTFVALAGVGDRFNGNVFVGGVNHSIAGGLWRTRVELGLAPESFASQRPDVAAPPAAGLVPPVRGLQTGIVKQVATDPTGNFRVLVTLPLVGGDDGIWARVGQFYASNGFGAGFFPEVGDEVVLGFMDEDPGNAVILASVYSSGRAPAFPPDEGNDLKALVTRYKLAISFDDENKLLTIKTPKGRLIQLDDTNNQLTLKDGYGNSMVMAEDSVSIVSAAKLNLSSKTDMTISSGAGLTVTANAKLSLHGLDVAINADSSCAIASNAMASLKAAGELAVSGALVKIN
jgi:Rhs element Vgr protein